MVDVSREDEHARAVGDGLYVYCIVPGAHVCEWPGAGLDGAHVFTVASSDLSAVVHACSAEPYAGRDEQVRAWVSTHAAVVELAWERWGTVVPMGFDVIVKAAAGRTARENVLAWLADNRERLHAKLEELEGCQEYGVQVVMDWKRALEAMSRSSEKALALGREMAGKPEGIRYLYRERIERVLRAEAESAASAACRDCCERISRLARSVRVSKPRSLGEDRQMFLNLAVLVRADRVAELGDELDRVAASSEIVEVRFTGPWPPYSFAGIRGEDSSDPPPGAGCGEGAAEPRSNTNRAGRI